MDNQEQTTEQMEQAERREITKQLEQSIKLGEQLQTLRATKEFKAVFQEIFLETGLDVLWQNVRHLKEEQLKGRGSDKNEEIIGLMEGQIKTRLDFAGFLDTVDNDANNAIENLREINAEITAEAVAEGSGA